MLCSVYSASSLLKPAENRVRVHILNASPCASQFLPLSGRCKRRSRTTVWEWAGRRFPGDREAAASPTTPSIWRATVAGVTPVRKAKYLSDLWQISLDDCSWATRYKPKLCDMFMVTWLLTGVIFPCAEQIAHVTANTYLYCILRCIKSLQMVLANEDIYS